MSMYASPMLIRESEGILDIPATAKLWINLCLKCGFSGRNM